jgi:uncharacterized protein
LKIVLDHILGKPLELKGDKPVESFPALMEIQSAGECTFTAPVSYSVAAAKEYDHIRVTGNVNTVAKLSCSRCLEEFEFAIDSSFTIIYRRGVSDTNVAEEDETELSEEDLIASTYVGDEIDLTHDLEEQVAMSVPLKPLCAEHCKGLCPDCGVDLNQSSCTCTEKAFNFKFSALKDFKVK